MKNPLPFQTFSAVNFHTLCDKLSRKDKDLALVISTNGYPPMWTRPNSFETLVHFILEQQVSLASALAALNKLREKIGVITPEKFLLLSDAELRACYLSRQKTIYTRFLAESIMNGALNLKEMEALPDAEVRQRLNTLKGIGNWTIDVYLMFVLRHTDIFPAGDLAAINALLAVKNLPKDTPREKLLRIAEKWAPYRTIATMILWHYYLLSRKKIQTRKDKIITPLT
jgi:DNA-3-methyladenine glycosylase II